VGQRLPVFLKRKGVRTTDFTTFIHS
jgi:hypothetical protein